MKTDFKKSGYITMSDITSLRVRRKDADIRESGNE